MSKLEEYLNQDIYNPKYLFHGSSLPLKEIVPMQSQDSYNVKNEDKAVFLSSCFQTSAAYAFRGKLKEINSKYWDFYMNNNGERPYMTFAVENFSDDISGYIYVFNINNDMIKDKDGGKEKEKKITQYRCYHSLIPDDVVTIKYSDYAEYFEKITCEEFNKKYKR